MAQRWRLVYEDARIAWITRDSPSRPEICAAIEWIKRCKSLGPPVEGSIRSTDPDHPDDLLAAMPGANAAVLYMAHQGREESVLLVRDLTSVRPPVA